jgi:AraC-like DNA-binding protein
MNLTELIKYKNKLTYAEYQPSAQIGDFVDCYWWFENNLNEKLDFTILPDGAFDLIIHFVQERINIISLTGISTEKADVSIGPKQQLFGIRFKLLATDYVVKDYLAPYLNGTKQLAPTFWQINRIDFSDLEKAITHFNQHILSELDNTHRIDLKKKKLFKLLEQTKGQLQVSEYSGKVFWSSRQINRYFNKRFGLSLKEYCNILKVHSSLIHIKKGQLFPEQDYYDQSHFIKSVKRYTGKNPKSLKQNKNDRFLQLLPNTNN